MPAGLADGVTANVASLVGTVSERMASVPDLVDAVSGRLPDRDQLATLEAAGRERLRQLAESGIVASGVQAGTDPRRRRQLLVPLGLAAAVVGVVLVVRARRRRAQARAAGQPLISV